MRINESLVYVQKTQQKRIRPYDVYSLRLSTVFCPSFIQWRTHTRAQTASNMELAIWKVFTTNTHTQNDFISFCFSLGILKRKYCIHITCHKSQSIEAFCRLKLIARSPILQVKCFLSGCVVCAPFHLIFMFISIFFIGMSVALTDCPDSAAIWRSKKCRPKSEQWHDALGGTASNAFAILLQRKRQRRQR